jgi:hypothetical protein
VPGFEGDGTDWTDGCEEAKETCLAHAGAFAAGGAISVATEYSFVREYDGFGMYVCQVP